MRRLLVLAAALAACIPPPGQNVHPERASARLTVRASRPAVIGALSAAAIELGMTTADANAEAGFWRSTRLHVPLGALAEAMTGAMDLDLTAILEDMPPDSIRITTTGTTGFIYGSGPSSADRIPITRDARRAFAYIDSLMAKAGRRLR